jgi:hypothetical protein
MTKSHSTPQQATFDQFDPLAALRDLVALDSALQPEATEQWFIVFSPWINAVARKARLEHSKSTSGLGGKAVDRIVKKMVIRIVTDTQNYPDKAQYIGSLEHAVLEQVRYEVAAVQSRHEITTGTPGTQVTRGSALEGIRLQLAADKGRAPTRAEVIAEWNQRKTTKA